MNRNSNQWLRDSLDSCCKRYFSWNEQGCKSRNAELTLVSGDVQPAFDVTNGLFYPDWGNTDDTCINDGDAPAYMKKQYKLWMYETLEECCKSYYAWEPKYSECLTSQGGELPPDTFKVGWYVNWKDFKCVESCDGQDSCDNIPNEWDDLYTTKSECCDEHLSWLEDSDDC